MRQVTFASLRSVQNRLTLQIFPADFCYFRETKIKIAAAQWNDTTSGIGRKSPFDSAIDVHLQCVGSSKT